MRIEYAQKLIAALPEELRYPLVLSAMEELNSRQIADVLRISESTVRGRIFRARQMLKERLASMTEKKS
jgi:RNA polymerase sigma-70 factor (ECF subfamily)